MPTIGTRIPQSITYESKVRLVALFVLLITGIYILNGSIFLPLFLVVDFGFRSFDVSKYSPLAIVSDWLARTLRLPVKPLYFPPKRFASCIGFVFSIAILLLHIAGINNVSISGLLAFFAALESLAGICVACYVFDFIQRLKKIE